MKFLSPLNNLVPDFAISGRCESVVIHRTMSKSSSRAVQGLLRLRYSLHRYIISPAPPFSRTHSTSTVQDSFARANPSSFGSSNSGASTSKFRSNGSIPTKPTSFTSSSNLGLSQVLPFSRAAQISYGCRQFSLKAPELGNFAKKVLEKPASAFTSTFARHRGAIGLQIESFLKRNYLVLLGAGGVIVCALLWRIMFGIANTFIGFSEGMAKYGFLALSAAIVAFAGLYVRARFTINPDRVYRIAMRMLNTHAGILEVMGAPLVGSDLRAYVMSGGGVTLNKFKPRLRSKRCFLLFPIQGSERKGLVSIEVKKKNGQYDMKLVAVDIPMPSEPDQRIFLIGDEEEYKVGGGLISMLRDPVLKAMAAAKEFDHLDEVEEKEDEERRVEEAERKHREEIEKLEQQP